MIAASILTKVCLQPHDLLLEYAQNAVELFLARPALWQLAVQVKQVIGWLKLPRWIHLHGVALETARG